MKKHLLLISIASSAVLLGIAAYLYPGGSEFDPAAIGFDLRHNYLCNLFKETAINGQYNPGRLWAIVGMVFLSGTFAAFFIRASGKIPHPTGARIIKWCGVGAAICAFLAVTLWHNLMTNIGVVLAMLALFYLMVFIFKTRLIWLKILSIVSLAALYFSAFIYYTQIWIDLLPIMQKIEWALLIAWMLSLEYFTEKQDFAR